MRCRPELGAGRLRLLLEGVDDAGVGEPLGDGVHMGRSAFQRAVDSLRGVADLVREARQVFHHYAVPGIEDDRGGPVQGLMQPRGGALNGVVDLGREMGQTVLDARRHGGNAVGQVVGCGLEPFLDLGRSGIQAVLQAGNCPVHCCFHAGGCPVLRILNCVVD